MLHASAWSLGFILSVAHVMLATAVTGHIVLTKEDVRAAIGWTGLVWLSPIVGSLAYALFGINRIRRRAPGRRHAPSAVEGRVRMASAGRALEEVPANMPNGWSAVAKSTGVITGLPLTPGNDIGLLVNGDEAYPAMLAAIDGATRSVAFATYIFDHGVVGERFVQALARAVSRGVTVRVLIDGVGARYSHPPIRKELRSHGVTVAHFLPSLMPLPHPYFNLRLHRKLLVADGAIGFVGGLNVRDDCLLALARKTATQDVHFRLRGPVVKQLLSAFAFDWEFTTHEKLDGTAWWPPLHAAGTTLARGIPDGPDEDFEALRMTMLGAISHATRLVRIATPYFLPDASLIDALRVAALRGVRVEIVLPQRGNLRAVDWAVRAQLPQLMAWGCHVYLSLPPFDHSKLFVVDGVWSLIGSANWDPRSLRLNFEYGVECYSTELAALLEALIDAKIAKSRAISLAELLNRPLFLRLRDGLTWLAQPYL